MLCLLASGKTATQIAAELSLSVKTVSIHRSCTLEKTHMKTNAELIHYAIWHQLAVLVEVLSQDGYTVDIAGNGEEALEKLRQQAFDVIMCDIRMPKMNGPAFYRG